MRKRKINRWFFFAVCSFCRIFCCLQEYHTLSYLSLESLISFWFLFWMLTFLSFLALSLRVLFCLEWAAQCRVWLRLHLFLERRIFHRDTHRHSSELSCSWISLNLTHSWSRFDAFIYIYISLTFEQRLTQILPKHDQIWHDWMQSDINLIININLSSILSYSVVCNTDFIHHELQCCIDKRQECRSLEFLIRFFEKLFISYISCTLFVASLSIQRFLSISVFMYICDLSS